MNNKQFSITARYLLKKMYASGKSGFKLYGKKQPRVKIKTRTLTNMIGKNVHGNNKLKCALCGRNINIRLQNGNPAAISADRIKSSIRIYRKNNIQFTHAACNIKRGHDRKVSKKSYRRNLVNQLSLYNKKTI
jgi:hypothetical protein